MKKFGMLTMTIAIMLFMGIASVNAATAKSSGLSQIVAEEGPYICFAGVNTNEIHFGWTTVKNAKYYDVYTKTKQGDKWTKLVTTTKSEYTHKNLKAGSVHYYYVRALNSKKQVIKNGKSTVFVTIPLKTTIKVKSVTSNSVKLSFTSVSGITRYEILRKDGTNGKWKVIKQLTAAGTYNDKTVKAGKKYYYKVRTVKEAKENGKVLEKATNDSNVVGITAK